MTENEAVTTPDSPQSIADEFKDGIKSFEEEEGVKLAVPGVRRSRAPKKEAIARPEWEPEKIGMVACYLHDAVFAAYDMPPMEPEETDSLSATTAYYLNERWPEGAKYEPEMRLAAELSGLWVPRLMAKQREGKAVVDDLGELTDDDINQTP